MARSTKHTSVSVIGDLTDEDLGYLSEERGIKPPALKDLKMSHHRLAQVLASGATDSEAMAICGVSRSRISILRSDPMFRELVESFRLKKSELATDVMGMFRDLVLDGLQEIKRRVDEEPETISTDTLIKMISDLADRIGHGRTEKHLHAHIVGTPGEVQELKQAAALARRGRVSVISDHRTLDVSTAQLEDLASEIISSGGEGEDLREQDLEVSPEVDAFVLGKRDGV